MNWDPHWRRWAAAGYPVIIGSRTKDRTIEAAAQIDRQVRGAENVEAEATAEVIVLAVPYSNRAHPGSHPADRSRQHRSRCRLAACSAKSSVVQLPQGHSAVLEATAILGADVKVVSAFHKVG